MDDTPAPQPVDAPPPELTALLEARDQDTQDSAWAGFVATYSLRIMQATRAVHSRHDVSPYDAMMDRYTYALEQLREDGFRRLRSFVADGRAKFTTWLTVVVRRLCLDHHRHRYGRAREQDEPGETDAAARATRRRLADLVGEGIDLNRMGSGRHDPEARLRAADLSEALARALSQLSPRDRLLLAMRFEDDLSARQIAEVMGFPTPFHVYRRVNALLASLRNNLADRGIDDPVP